jgi:hypothetical protein
LSKYRGYRCCEDERFGKIQDWERVEYAGISEREFLDFSFQFSDKDNGQQRMRLPCLPLNISYEKARNDKNSILSIFIK